MLLNVLDFATPQAALDAAVDGDAVYFPGIQFPTQPTYVQSGGFRITKSLEIYGDGPGDVAAYTGTVFQAAGEGEPVFVIEPPDPGTIVSVVLRDFKIKTPPTTGVEGIRCVLGANQTVESLRLERINVLEVGGAGFRIEGVSLDGGQIRMLAMLDCVAYRARGYGAILKQVASARLVRTVMNDNGRGDPEGGGTAGGMLCEASGVALYLPAFDVAATDPVSPASEPQLTFLNARIARVDAGHFENFSRTVVAEAVRFQGAGGAAVFGASNLANLDPPGPSTGLVVVEGGTPENRPAGPVVVLPNSHTRVQPDLIQVDAGAADVTLLPQFNDPRVDATTETGAILLPANPENGGTLAMPYVRRIQASDSPAALIIQSATADSVSGLVDGMLLYRSDTNQLRVRVGGSWRKVIFA